MSLGRGTANPFEIYGHPAMKTGSPLPASLSMATDTTFTPLSMSGAANPPLKGQKCRGRSLRSLSDDEILARGVDFSYVIDAYRNTTLPAGKQFFTSFFNLLTGNSNISKMIQQGKSAEEIKASWADDLARFRKLRSRYLLYPEK